MLSQKKIELAVLHKLRTLADEGRESPTPADIMRALQNGQISLRRAEVALEELEKLGQAECYPDPTDGVYRWRITREGFGVVDRALRVPVSFIARLAEHGDTWLSSEDAQKAVLNKLPETPQPKDSPQPVGEDVHPAPIRITNTFSPVNQAPATSDESGRSVARATWFNAIIALLVGAGLIAATLWVAGKI